MIGDHDIKPLGRPNLTREVVDSIAQLIVKGTWRPGDAIPAEKELAERFGVGRSTIREAIQSLVIIGVVEIRRGEGSYIRDPGAGGSLLSGAFIWGLLLSPRNVHQFTDFRRCIEEECAGMAAARRSPESVEHLYSLLKQMSDNQDDDRASMEADNQFHVTIAKAGGNDVFVRMVETLQSLVRLWFPVTCPDTGTAEATLEEHKAVVDAIAAQDEIGARTAMRRHLTNAGSRLARLLLVASEGGKQIPAVVPIEPR